MVAVAGHVDSKQVKGSALTHTGNADHVRLGVKHRKSAKRWNGNRVGHSKLVNESLLKRDGTADHVRLDARLAAE